MRPGREAFIPGMETSAELYLDTVFYSCIYFFFKSAEEQIVYAYHEGKSESVDVGQIS